MENGKICIVISTRNRPEAFLKSLSLQYKYKPLNALLFAVDDASDPEYIESNYRFEKRAGIPKVKNKCLQLAMDSGSDHIFLFDDDIFPKVMGWEKPYIESGINHLSYNFEKAYNGVPRRLPKKVIGEFTVSQIPNGAMMYFTRECIEKIGGFDERYGLGCYEHTDLTRRIHNAGLTPYKNMDVVGSEKLFHSMDEHGEVERSFSENERIDQLLEGQKLFYANSESKEYIKIQ